MSEIGTGDSAATAAVAERSASALAGMEELRCSQTFAEAVALLRAAALELDGAEHGRESGGTAGIQPRWRAVGEEVHVSAQVQSVHEHLHHAVTVELPTEACPGEAGVDASTITAVRKVAQDRGAIVGWRRRQMEVLHRCALMLQRGNRRLLARLAPSHLLASHQPTVHAALVEALTVALGLSDVGVAEALVRGQPATGDVPSSNNWLQDEQPAEKALTAGDNAEWNDWLRGDIASKPAGPRDGAVWERTIKECDEGLIDGPWTFQDMNDMFGEGGWRAMRRFGIEQGGKIRACEHALESGHNAATTLHERIQCVGADFPARVAVAFSHELGWDGGEWHMRLATDDLHAAYRRVPCATPGLTVCAVKCPATGRVTYWTMTGFNFGLKAAVNGFNRVPHCVVQVARRMLAVCTAHYFDDFPVAEPSFAGASGQRALTELLDVIGFPLAPEKSVPPATVGKFLGVVTDFSSLWETGEISMYVADERKEKLVQSMRQLRRRGAMSQAEAASLCGKLGFVTMWAWGRFGRAVMQPIMRRQMDKRGMRTGLGRPIGEALDFLISILPRLPRRTLQVRRDPRPTVKVWTDAMWEATAERPAGLGVVAYFPAHCTRSGVRTDAWYAHASMYVDDAVLARFVKSQQYIGQLELLAAVAAYRTFAAELRGRRVVHWIDNTSALAALVKGYSSRPDSALIVHAFHAFNVGLGARVWFEYVASKANIADLPSRGEFELLRELHSVERKCVLPPLDSWAASAAEWVDLAVTASATARYRHRRAPAGAGEAVRPPRRAGKRRRTQESARMDVTAQ